MSTTTNTQSNKYDAALQAAVALSETTDPTAQEDAHEQLAALLDSDTLRSQGDHELADLWEDGSTTPAELADALLARWEAEEDRQGAPDLRKQSLADSWADVARQAQALTTTGGRCDEPELEQQQAALELRAVRVWGLTPKTPSTQAAWGDWQDARDWADKEHAAWTLQAATERAQ